QRFKEAATMAISLVSYSKSFAPYRREAWHVSAYYRTKDQREAIQKAMEQSFAEGQCKLLESKDPTEIAIFYYVDGIPMSAADDIPELECKPLVVPDNQEDNVRMNGHSIQVDLAGQPAHSTQNGQGSPTDTVHLVNGNSPATSPEPLSQTGQPGPSSQPVQNS